MHGIKRRTSLFNTNRIDHLYEDPHQTGRHFMLHYGDLTDSSSLIRIVQEVKPDEIYNLGGAKPRKGLVRRAGVHGKLRCARARCACLRRSELRDLKRLRASIRPQLQNCTALCRKFRRRETTPFYPRSPYAVAKLYAYWITVNYREAYGMYACNGILFNHESPQRGETFVTRKITRALARIKVGLQDRLYLGNMDALRDWGHARDYVEMQWLMLQQEEPRDYVIATGEQHSVREFVDLTASFLDMEITWEGAGAEEKGLDKNGNVVVAVDPRYYRPTEVETLLGDAGKAKRELGWKPRITFRELVKEMVEEDLKAAERDALVRKHGYSVFNFTRTDCGTVWQIWRRTAASSSRDIAAWLDRRSVVAWSKEDIPNLLLRTHSRA